MGLNTALPVLLAAGMLAACAPEDTAETDTLPADTAALVQQPAAGALNDAQIAHFATTANTADSSGGVMAQEKGSNAAVKAYGQRMVQDHGSANQQARQLVQSAALTPQENERSAQLRATHDSASQRLRGLSGAEFDRAYIAHEIQMHQSLLTALDQDLIPNAQNAQLRQLLEGIRPTVQSHLEQAQQIQQNLGGAASDTTAGTGP
jgi:putative membrane protein